MINILNFIKKELVPLSPIGTFIGTMFLALVTFYISKSDRLHSAFSFHKNDIDKTVEDLVKNCDFLNVDLFSELKKKYRSEEFENNINIKSTNSIPALLNFIFTFYKYIGNIYKKSSEKYNLI